MSHAVTSVMESFSQTSTALGDTSANVGGSMSGMMNIFVNFPEEKMGFYITMVILIITIANIIAGKIVKGGDNYMYYAFGSILFALSGMVYIVTPYIVNMFFTIPTM